jgi:hypothetical protein
MRLELARVVAELVEAVGTLGQLEGGKNGVLDLLGCLAADLTAAMQEDFEEVDDTGIVDLKADNEGRARRWSSGKSTWTLSHCAWKPAKRAVMVWKRSRTA